MSDLFDDEMFEAEEPKPRRASRRASRRAGGAAAALRGETAKRILVAIPWIVFAIAIIVAGGARLRGRDGRRSASLCLREYFAMTERAAADPARRLRRGARR